MLLSTRWYWVLGLNACGSLACGSLDSSSPTGPQAASHGTQDAGATTLPGGGEPTAPGEGTSNETTPETPLPETLTPEEPDPAATPSIVPSTAPEPSSDATNPDTAATTPDPVDLDCSLPAPGRAPLRRLSNFEYSSTLSDLLGDTTQPGDALPLEAGRYSNDADQQTTPRGLVEMYQAAAKDVVVRALGAQRFPCMTSVTAETEAACAQSIIESIAPQAFRRPLETEEFDELLALQTTLRADGTFEESISSLLEAILQGPDFLYRLEFGVDDAANAPLRRPSSAEMATRLSYLFWGTMPDDELAQAAVTGELDTPEGVLSHATRMLNDERSRPALRYFFDHFLRLQRLQEVVRDPLIYPTFDSNLASMMREETQGFLEREIFLGSGTWSGVLTSPNVFVNEELAAHYGIADVTGADFRSVEVTSESSKRLGLLTQGGVLAATTQGNFTSPVSRGMFVLVDLMCQSFELPTDPALLAQVTPPEPTVAATARERFQAVTLQDPQCASCHEHIDPVGFALENFDAVGAWREQENGVPIDASGSTALLGEFAGPFELIQRVAENDATYTCFTTQWAEFAYGRKLDPNADACVNQALQTSFATSGYNVKELLLALTQTDAFLRLPAAEVAP